MGETQSKQNKSSCLVDDGGVTATATDDVNTLIQEREKDVLTVIHEVEKDITNVLHLEERDVLNVIDSELEEKLVEKEITNVIIHTEEQDRQTAHTIVKDRQLLDTDDIHDGKDNWKPVVLWLMIIGGVQVYD
eukprot:CAMPEP_0170813222 /NCGR_PEP_ID=MMETSP0733-20121128/36663_1 /TAXON_ID=186038 /ORGANISM="Fragilariopsis kerguelensis, Strain L26-C5" /LENGTH=132 /DNA_ID=CAMNT_0011170405 /DNA_START=97 /DNA_END=493 /DNA_ORIENTATION=-